MTDEATIARLRELCRTADPEDEFSYRDLGAVARNAIPRLCDDIASLRAELDAARREINEALAVTESCSSLREMAAACIEGAAAWQEIERLRAALMQFEDFADARAALEPRAEKEGGE